uniref:Thioredoxin domain-containing protein n=1 Tax=Hyaloperonospora arabidopsidis (strain Emoy2) TaxID=559515 RepID=M4BVH2_HYAAE
MPRGGIRHVNRCVPRRHWVVVTLGVCALCFMFLFQLRLWSAANHVDLRTNAIGTARDPDPAQTDQVADFTRVSIEALETVKKPPNLRLFGPSRLETVTVLTHGSLVVTTAAPLDPLRAPGPSTTEAPPHVFTNRHDVVSGYDAAMKYLANYTTPEGSNEQLFLFFVCGDEQGGQMEWRRVCVDASKVVYNVFATSPARNRLLTIHAGSRQSWSTPNAFFKDSDLKVKIIPAIMQWHGGGKGAKRATSGMIIDEDLLYEPLLRYLFKNEDVIDSLVTPEKIATKEIVVLKGYKNYRSYMDTIAAGGNSSLTAPVGSMFLFFVAGRLPSNDRPWCPYCRYSEISVEYAFYAFAPNRSRLVKVETVNSYGLWREPANEWKQDIGLMIRGVPWMYRASLDTQAHVFSYDRIIDHFNRPEDLRGVFEGWKNPSM